MIVVPIILQSARNGKYTTLSSLTITNDGTGTDSRGNYKVELLDKRMRVMRDARIEKWPRKQRHVSELVTAAFKAVEKE